MNKKSFEFFYDIEKKIGDNINVNFLSLDTLEHKVKEYYYLKSNSISFGQNVVFCDFSSHCDEMFGSRTIKKRYSLKEAERAVKLSKI
jgi:hypothetical protein